MGSREKRGADSVEDDAEETVCLSSVVGRVIMEVYVKVVKVQQDNG